MHLRRGESILITQFIILDFKRKKICGGGEIFFLGGGVIFSMGDFSWEEGGGTLPQNSNKPSRDL